MLDIFVRVYQMFVKVSEKILGNYLQQLFKPESFISLFKFKIRVKKSKIETI